MIDIIKGKIFLTMLLGMIGLSAIVFVQTDRLEKSNASLKIAVANEKAAIRGTLIWKDKFGMEHANSIQYEKTLDKFKYSQDSVTKEMYKMFKQSDAKLKKLIQAGFVHTTVDTVLQSNTVFAIPDTTVDLSNKDITNIITFRQGVLASKVGLENKQFLFWNEKKETVRPPKKFFISRWLQKRHTLTEVDVVNSNQLIKVNETKFILTEENKKKD